jgi:hypothetical protein
MLADDGVITGREARDIVRAAERSDAVRDAGR